MFSELAGIVLHSVTLLCIALIIVHKRTLLGITLISYNNTEKTAFRKLLYWLTQS